ncbi:response regulator [Undibacterium flavidum]|uniref:Response regulator n=1 Tax=Undibacterium flavidum TaxID=2762297 RepID=A0ABR6Y6T9_9BURK|nr:response regulator [Undibacterium flavidum]MBC3872328.1 response regulator [Undibacterium flavidum]
MTTVHTTHNILLAEDNDFNQEIVVDLLTEAGYRVTAKDNGKELLDELLTKTDDYYQLILMDLEMPVLDGHQATIAIRKESRFDQIPIIAMTAHTQEDTKIRCLQEGMQDFISKPFNPTELFAIINKWNSATPDRAPAISIAIDDEQSAHRDHSEQSLQFHFNTIDSQRGLQLSGNNIALYLQLLKRFQTSQVNNLIILKAVKESDLQTLEFKRMIHTLKGVSATIGGTQLANIIEGFEAYLNAANAQAMSMTTANTYLQAIADLLSLSITEIQLYFAKLNPVIVETTSAADQTKEIPMIIDGLIEALISLLEASSSDAIDFFHQHASAFQRAFTHQDYAQLSACIDQYEFEQAISHLRSHE